MLINRANVQAAFIVHRSSFSSILAVAHDAPLQPDFSSADGLVPAIAQDAVTGEVLMMAWMNAESYAETLATGRAVYYSRSRKRLWRKGEESGHAQLVRGVYIDCDADTILLKVVQVGGAACHEGYRSCFFREITPDGVRVAGERIFDPASAYKSSTKE
ncbi:MAG TPA: phosphoribosyl-AMP cyclohydrolase [Lacipirellulaceae bacterium]|jgi:phosphoribosyl-AMP cyclohydrolase|nr:phosphoribosyl-AMP cyclohydrolase [Lacipirellulaceae bacterium]